MPVSEYFKGKGEQVLSSMEKRYGDKAGKRVFYATANSRGMTPRKTARAASRATRSR